jgi:cell division protein FtsB
MSEIEQSAQRLAAALERVEAAIGRRNASGASTAARVTELEGEVARLKADNLALQDAIDAIAGRLDQAIDRLKAELAG